MVNDYDLPDNAGGVSLDIERVDAVPEPPAWALMIGDLGAIGGVWRRRRQDVTVRFATT